MAVREGEIHEKWRSGREQIRNMLMKSFEYFSRNPFLLNKTHTSLQRLLLLYLAFPLFSRVYFYLVQYIFSLNYNKNKIYF